MPPSLPCDRQFAICPISAVGGKHRGASCLKWKPPTPLRSLTSHPGQEYTPIQSTQSTELAPRSANGSMMPP